MMSTSVKSKKSVVKNKTPIFVGFVLLTFPSAVERCFVFVKISGSFPKKITICVGKISSVFTHYLSNVTHILK